MRPIPRALLAASALCLLLAWAGRATPAVAAERPASLGTAPAATPSTCAWSNSWNALPPTGLLTPRSNFAQVWAGSTMFIFGGEGGAAGAYVPGLAPEAPLGDGARYDPAASAWSALPPPPQYTFGEPLTGPGLSAVWTGQEVLLVGSFVGARYSPASNTWSRMFPGAPDTTFASAVWTGSELLAWGGLSSNDSASNGGGAYTPATDTWTQMATPSLAGRIRQSAVWTGSELLIWGGWNGGYGLSSVIYNDGARYNPATDSWQSLPAAGAPSARYGQVTVWTGTDMLVWGGFGPNGTLRDGARFSLMTSTWSPISTVGAPNTSLYSAAVWTGSEMIVSDGTAAGTARYNPATNTWAPVSAAGAPGPIDGGAEAVWTGNQMLIWGGTYENTGAAYNPNTNTWTPIPTTGALSGGSKQGVWTGTQALIWGGTAGTIPFTIDQLHGAGSRYTPATNAWTPMATAGAPSPRDDAAVVWTGSEMLVWGGKNGFAVLGDGARYNPATNTWKPISTLGAPIPRSAPAAVWTGRELLVWGGGGLLGLPLSDGARYDPATDTWTPMARAGAPSPGQGYGAVWTGSQMLVWAGSGARYDPITNTWSPIADAGAPPGGLTLVWTGQDMLAFSNGPGGVPASGRYDPSTDRWASISEMNAPDTIANRAVWSGSEALLWGGLSLPFDDLTNIGGRYNPVTDTWASIPTAGAPLPRKGEVVLWTNCGMLVWGGAGSNVTAQYDDGALYSPPPPPTTGGQAVGIATAPGQPVGLTWSAGANQTGYLLLRASSGGAVSLLPPSGTPLPATATSYVDDTAPPDQVDCYSLLPIGATGPIGTSNVFCVLPNAGSALGAPPTLVLALSPAGLSVLSWSPPGSQSGYTMIAQPEEPGATPRVQILPGDARGTIDDTKGIPTCYVLGVIAGAAISGNSDVLCAVPGADTIPTVATRAAVGSRTTTLDAARSVLRQAVERVRSVRVAAPGKHR